MLSKIIKKKTFYCWMISFALITHVFNQIEFGGFKLFHIPATIAFICPLIFRFTITKVQILLYFLASISFIASFFTPNPESSVNAIKFTIVIGACASLPIVSYSEIIRQTNILIPMGLFGLLIHLRSEVIFRYQGYYSDPNYLCTTLIVFTVLILQNLYQTESNKIRILNIIELLIIAIIILATISRTGMLCFSLILFISTWRFIKQYKLIALLIIFLGSTYLVINTPPEVLTVIESLQEREESNVGDDASSAAHHRFALSLSGITYVLDHPSYILFGIGIGSVGKWHYFKISRNNTVIDHNTITSTFSELGIIGFVILITILYDTLKNCLKSPSSDKFKYIRLSAFIAICIFSTSINMTTYFPYWFFIMLLNNKNIINSISNNHEIFCNLKSIPTKGFSKNTNYGLLLN